MSPRLSWVKVFYFPFALSKFLSIFIFSTQTFIEKNWWFINTKLMLAYNRDHFEYIWQNKKNAVDGISRLPLCQTSILLARFPCDLSWNYHKLILRSTNSTNNWQKFVKKLEETEQTSIQLHDQTDFETWNKKRQAQLEDVKFVPITSQHTRS